MVTNRGVVDPTSRIQAVRTGRALVAVDFGPGRHSVGRAFHRLSGVTGECPELGADLTLTRGP
jgi:hypothetical protein